MRHFIWVYTVCQKRIKAVTCIQSVKLSFELQIQTVDYLKVFKNTGAQTLDNDKGP